jgi:hypothetical protein
MVEKNCNFDPVRKMVLPVAPLFYLGVDFKVFFYQLFNFLSSCLKKVVILTQLQKMVLPVAPRFDLGVDFHVFYAKI